MYENLIKRLREYPDGEEDASGYVEIDLQDISDAADTIESLTGQLSAIQSENAEKDKKIERLKIELRYKQDECDSHYGDFCEAKVDISRVEAERDVYKGRYLVTTKNNVKLEAKLNAAVAFIQRIDREYGRYIVDVGFERWRGVQGGG